jgi:hypothetical protein
MRRGNADFSFDAVLLFGSELKKTDLSLGVPHPVYLKKDLRAKNVVSDKG